MSDVLALDSLPDVSAFEQLFLEELIPCRVEAVYRARYCGNPDEHAADLEILWSCGCVDPYCSTFWAWLNGYLVGGWPIFCEKPEHAATPITVVAVVPLGRNKDGSR